MNATETILTTQIIPSTVSVLNGTKIQREGEYLKICDLENLVSLVVKGTARTIRFYVMFPANGLNDNCRLEHVYTAKRSIFCKRHIEHGIEYGVHGLRGNFGR